MISQENKFNIQELETIVGKDNISLWQDIDQTKKQQISQAIAPETTINCIVYPETQAQLSTIVTCCAKNNWAILPCGSGSKVHWGGLMKVDPTTHKQGIIVVSSDRLNHLIEHAVGDLTVTVEAGMKYAELQETLAKTGQFLAIDPAYPETATIGGIVATADTGSLRQRYRGVRDMLLGISFVRSDGKIAKAGGRVVKNVAGYDLMKLFTGSYGTLGIISQVTLRVYPLQQASGTVVLVGEKNNIAKATQTLLSSALTPVAIDLLSTKLVEQLDLGKGVGLMVRFQSIIESVEEQSNQLLKVGDSLGLNSTRYHDYEAELWQKLKQQIWHSQENTEIICKIGVMPREAVETLERSAIETGFGLIHAGSGLGELNFNSVTPETLLELRRWCESKGGFLTVLAAPLEIKEKLDVWGYSQNGLDIMRRIKQQFDSQNIFNPHSFVGGI
ncbi:MAG: FAD-binding oxidoreductase [Okeania sp. SIO2C9]|uniref:FAD-binding oxidoreductase n=1 Tax=Okeania sp. SIO2C9 TaxID=2607791 RepID=UPI0013C02830|nr:FAD-binding oxidoreductase [Okeania sp. SIO2C9]NEQ77766.1 FAD-binding oxidoreductase [Okeania sp. SIO2C9]